MVIPTAEMLRAAAKELDERAEEMIGDVRGVTGVDIWIRLRPDSIPEIQVSKDYTTQRQIRNYLDEACRQAKTEGAEDV